MWEGDLLAFAFPSILYALVETRQNQPFSPCPGDGQELPVLHLLG